MGVTCDVGEDDVLVPQLLVPVAAKVCRVPCVSDVMSHVADDDVPEIVAAHAWFASEDDVSTLNGVTTNDVGIEPEALESMTRVARPSPALALLMVGASGGSDGK